MDLNALKSSIREAEGFIPNAYFDSVGILTIGYGRMIDKKLGGGITRQEAEILLDNDIQACIDDLSTHFSWFRKLSDARQRALIEMRFQLGMTRLLGFLHMLINMENMDFKSAANEALNSKWANQAPKRAARIAEMIRTG